jgi:hypothetical protein
MRIDIKSWADVVNETDAPQTKLSLHIRKGVLDAYTAGSFMPDDGWYEIRPDKQQNHKEVEEIFYSWEQIYSTTHWQSDKPYWFIFTHPEKNLPCIVEFHAHGWIDDERDDYISLRTTGE